MYFKRYPVQILKNQNHISLNFYKFAFILHRLLKNTTKVIILVFQMVYMGAVMLKPV